MLRLTPAVLLLTGLSACATPHADAEATAKESCPTAKLAFTREDGCRNDGAVELCLPAGDAELLARVQALAPGARALSSRGRAACDTASEVLVVLPLEEQDCEARHGALRPAAWERLCRVAALPQVRALVPTWYE
ncbi:hypothetical protein LXT21_20840 [Myxococcus sp. K38C18041901]|uniref:hypothetical protein n=1 Tax=Myxococcus guangdongensis TaxID=2906760 RepID=UPI0020A7E2BA|nr:hypothetical protein [Myxococcus guangdongensis]MCP3061230.1 hypothetical protein [Myxococcus guangdongensis]